jgi:type IV pilus assembly protein PilB
MIGREDYVFGAMVESGALNAEAEARARRVASEKHMSLSDAAISLGLVSERTVAIYRADNAEYPFVDLSWYNVNYANAGLLSRELAEGLRAFPLFVCGGIATVGMEDPLDFRAVDRLRVALRADVAPVVCEAKALRSLIDRAYGITLGGAGGPAKDSSAPELTTGDEPIVAAVNHILAQALDLGASDVHLGPDERELCLRFRVDGVLRRVHGPSLEAHAGLVQRLKVMADLDLTQTRRPQDGKFRYSRMGRDVDVRVSMVPTVCGENVVLRILSSASSIRGFDELGFPVRAKEEFERLIAQPHGMILVTGPTGSGKTTTLYTALKRLNAVDVNIMTIEDPVEIRMPMIRQVQVNAGVGMTFANALRSILRQDPDVVFVGEIRDEETARISVQAALTGHLVLSSLHTNDAVGAIPRLRDLSCPAFAINAALLGVIAQRLVRRVCTDCARPVQPEESLMREFGLAAGEDGFREGAGCPRCAGEGLKGRVGIYELLRMTEEVRRAIDVGAHGDEIARAAARGGMRAMRLDGLDKARLGLTTLEEVARASTLGCVEVCDRRDEGRVAA